LDLLRCHLLESWTRPSLSRVVRLWLLAMTVLLSPMGAVMADEADVMSELNKLRGIQPTDDRNELDRLGKTMDSVWTFLGKNRADSVPIVTRELRKELTQRVPDQFFILDTAHFLVAKDDPKEDAQAKKELALDVFKRIDPKSRIVQYNFLGLVRFAHELSKLGDPRVLPEIDRIFLDSDRNIEFIEDPHWVKLPAHPIRVLLYGAFGPSVEDHLAKRLNEQGYEQHQRMVLALLVDLGSERSVDAVKRVLDTRGDLPHLKMAVNMLMRVGGPKGRDAVVMAKTEHLDPKARDYHQEILDSVKAETYDGLAAAIKKFDASDRVFDDAELSKRLKAYAESGVDREINASNVLTSKISKAELLTRLKQIRSRTLWRLNQHALEEVRLTNQIINAIQYKPD
jgi:hypothetical protein